MGLELGFDLGPVATNHSMLRSCTASALSLSCSAHNIDSLVGASPRDSRAMAEAHDEQKPKVLFLRPSFAPYHEALSKRFHLLKSWESSLPTPLFVAQHAASVRAMVISAMTQTSADLISMLPNLEFMATTSVGTDHIDLAECRRRGIRVADAGGVFSVDTADYAVGLLIDVMRRISAGDRYVRKGLWPVDGQHNFPLGSKLGGKRIGMVGLGKIGSEIAKRLEAFGCIISYNSRQRKPWLSYPYFSNVRELAAESDVLVVCCALNSETHYIINKDVMLALGKEGVVINVGRGAHIDEKELVQCLKRGDIGGAGLDVFENEPNVPEELFDMDNVVLSAHRAVTTNGSVEDLYELVAANLEAFFSNKPLLTPVSLE